MIEKGKYKGYELYIDKKANELYAINGDNKIRIFRNIDFVKINSNSSIKPKYSIEDSVNCVFSLYKEECYAKIPFEIYIWLIINGLK